MPRSVEVERVQVPGSPFLRRGNAPPSFWYMWTPKEGGEMLTIKCRICRDLLSGAMSWADATEEDEKLRAKSSRGHNRNKTNANIRRS